jgi:hypothetical protein
MQNLVKVTKVGMGLYLAEQLEQVVVVVALEDRGKTQLASLKVVMAAQDFQAA